MIIQNKLKWALLALVVGFVACKSGEDAPGPPNILLVMVDDMGYSDLGCYGGEIQTPHVDALAAKGLKFTQFYNAGRCCPTRATLLTGRYPHEVGMGWMTTADLGTSGYTGDLSPEHPTIGELLKAQGYRTYLAGKWHLTSYKKLSPDSLIKDSWPLQRGFDRFYGLIKGSSSFFKPEYLAYGNHLIEAPADYYFTDAISDSASSFIRSHVLEFKKDPFFLYVAYTAPHFPLHARPAVIQKYMEHYEKGWDSLRAKRLAKMERLGLDLPGSASVSRDPLVAPWTAWPDGDKKDMIKRMAVYAAQIDIMDQGMGRILETLEEQKQLENTLIVFLSDNGATNERISRKDTSYQALGTELSYETYRRPWANLSNIPFREYKRYMHEGGISTPLIIHWPDKMVEGRMIPNHVGHVIDLVPTFLEVAGVSRLKQQYIGKSLVPVIEGRAFDRGPLFWEHEANRAVRDGSWKLVSFAAKQAPYKGEWELYDLSKDRSESNNLAAQYPDKVAQLSKMWREWAESHQVLPLDGRNWGQRVKSQP